MGSLHFIKENNEIVTKSFFKYVKEFYDFVNLNEIGGIWIIFLRYTRLRLRTLGLRAVYMF